MSPFGLYEIKSKQFLEEGTTKNSFFIGDDTYNARWILETSWCAWQSSVVHAVQEKVVN